MATEYDTRDKPEREVTDELKQQSQVAKERAAAEGRAQTEHAASAAAEALDDIAAAAEREAAFLEADERENLSHYMADVADSIGNLALNLKQKSADELLHEASALARRNTGLFLLGSVAIGVGLARFAKASQPADQGASSVARSTQAPPGNATLATQNYLGGDARGDQRSSGSTPPTPNR